ncbi:MAG: glycosyltransferase family 2 protein, partial [Pseudomonadales bacterium]|nr:glycosyltransferase family 2 protein [Pseudomonadales bacterium]
PYSKGNGASIKTGARYCDTDVIVFMDSDGQHRPEDIPMLLAELDNGYDMVVGSRDALSQASHARLIGNTIYNQLASWVVGHKVMDLTSGFRAVRRHKFLEFLNLLPNGFSYPTTITMAFFKAGYSVAYRQVTMPERVGESHLSVIKDGIRFFLIIFKIATLHSPLKIFLPISLVYFFLGTGYYLFTYLTYGRFTNMSALMFSMSSIVFLIGLLSEQMTALFYQRNNLK